MRISNNAHSEMRSGMEIRPGVYSYELEWAYDEPLGVHVLDTERATVLFGAGSEDTADQLTEIATARYRCRYRRTRRYRPLWGVPALRAATDDLDVAAPAGDVAALEAAGLEVDDPLTTDNIYWGITPIAAPGHTPDNMAYLYEEILVAGDTVVSADSPFAAAGTGAAVRSHRRRLQCRRRAGAQQRLGPYRVRV